MPETSTTHRRASRARRLLGHALVVAVAFYAIVLGIAWGRVAVDDAVPSRSHGAPSEGSIEHAHPMPPWGPGWTTYSFLGSALGRQYLHGAVRDLLVAALQQTSETTPERTFVIAEIGWPDGGRFRPHATHRNGTSVDVLVPMRDADGAPVSLSSWPWNRFGYGHELDHEGRLGALELDREALATFLCTLDALGSDDARIRRVILAPELQPGVAAAMEETCRGHFERWWEREAVWIRHDEHFHVDFRVD